MNRPKIEDALTRRMYTDDLERYCDELEKKQEKYRWHDLVKNPNDLPDINKPLDLCYVNTKEDTNKLEYSSGYLDEYLVWDWFGFYEHDLKIVAWRYVEEFGNE